MPLPAPFTPRYRAGVVIRPAGLDGHYALGEPFWSECDTGRYPAGGVWMYPLGSAPPMSLSYICEDYVAEVIAPAARPLSRDTSPG